MERQQFWSPPETAFVSQGRGPTKDESSSSGTSVFQSSKNVHSVTEKVSRQRTDWTASGDPRRSRGAARRTTGGPKPPKRRKASSIDHDEFESNGLDDDYENATTSRLTPGRRPPHKRC
eukprot:Polyplicarium_translucidae@DN4053_c0_g1_i1.p3